MKRCKRENPTALRSKAALKDALLSLLEEEPLADISVGQICTRAQLTRPTFYNHYPTKEALAEEIIDDALEGFSSQVGYANVESTQGMLHAYLGYWEVHRDLLALIAQNGLLPMVAERFKPHLERIYTEASFTDKNITSHELAFQNAFLSAGMAGLLDYWAETEEPVNADAVASFMENMLKTLYAGMEGDPR